MRQFQDRDLEAFYQNNPAPGIHKFSHGYLNSPGSKIGEKRVYGDAYTSSELGKYGFRPDDRRGKAGRAAGPGRMNVRADPLNQGGMVTSVRSDTTRIDGRVNSADGGWTQHYKNNVFAWTLKQNTTTSHRFLMSLSKTQQTQLVFVCPQAKY